MDSARPQRREARAGAATDRAGGLRKDLSAYKVPRHLFVDRIDDLPFTDSGKIDKRRLAKLLAERIASARG